jgi:hypothetical protein
MVSRIYNRVIEPCLLQVVKTFVFHLLFLDFQNLTFYSDLIFYTYLHFKRRPNNAKIIKSVKSIVGIIIYFIIS